MEQIVVHLLRLNKILAWFTRVRLEGHGFKPTLGIRLMVVTIWVTRLLNGDLASWTCLVSRMECKIFLCTTIYLCYCIGLLLIIVHYRFKCVIALFLEIISKWINLGFLECRIFILRMWGLRKVYLHIILITITKLRVSGLLYYA